MARKAQQAILLQDVEKLGRKGDVVHVAAGHLRNYLAPRHMAEPATDARVAEVQRQSEQRARHEAQGDEQARDMAHVLNRTVLTIKRRAGIEDRLYGSVTSTDISDAIWKARRIRIDRRKVEARRADQGARQLSGEDECVGGRPRGAEGDGGAGRGRGGGRRGGVRSRAL